MIVIFRDKISLLTALLGLFYMSGLVAAQDSVGRTNDEPTREVIAKLINDLRSPYWLVREQAAQAMMGYGPEAYESLRTALRASQGYDARRRIKQIIQEIYIAQLVGPEPAFLGIEHTGRSEAFHRIPRIPAGSSGILVNRVFPATAADQAGLQRGDLILSLNGERAKGDRSALEFTRWIGSQTVGTPCRLGVLRGGEGIHLNQSDTPEFNPELFSKFGTTILQHEDDPRIPKGAAGLLITRTNPANPGLELEKGDLLIALDGEAIPLENTAEIFSKWTRGERIVKTPDQPQDRIQDMLQPQGNQAFHNPGRNEDAHSVQILRGGSWIDLDVVLGRRPDYLPDRRTGRGASRAKSVNEAMASFETWWDEWLRSDGLTTDQLDAEAYWRLEP